MEMLLVAGLNNWSYVSTDQLSAYCMSNWSRSALNHLFPHHHACISLKKKHVQVELHTQQGSQTVTELKKKFQSIDKSNYIIKISTVNFYNNIKILIYLSMSSGVTFQPLNPYQSTLHVDGGYPANVNIAPRVQFRMFLLCVKRLIDLKVLQLE